MVRYLDLRSCMVVLINMVKSPRIVSWDLMITCSFILVLSVFFFVSIEVPLSLTTCAFHIRLRFGNRPVSAAVSLMAALILPQTVFWYAYPTVILVQLYFYPIARFVSHAIHSIIPIDQVYHIFIRADVQVINEEYPQQDYETNSETPDLEGNVHAL